MIRSADVKAFARSAGFDLCGIARCRPLEKQSLQFEGWLARGYGGGLAYLHRRSRMRFDPGLLYEGARTVIVCAIHYAGVRYPDRHRTKIASYALAKDYHITIKDMLSDLSARMESVYPHFHGRAFTDTAPIAEKHWAVEAGLGWIGKHSLLVTPGYGSFVLLGEIVTDAQADVYDTPFAENRCGSCTRCMDACPVCALPDRGVVNACKCIARQTIERPDPAAPYRADALHGWIFGCDECQAACPYNRDKNTSHPALHALFDPLTLPAHYWSTLTDETFTELYAQTPLARSGLQRLRGNISDRQEYGKK